MDIGLDPTVRGKDHGKITVSAVDFDSLRQIDRVGGDNGASDHRPYRTTSAYLSDSNGRGGEIRTLKELNRQIAQL